MAIYWIILGLLAALAAYQQYRMFAVRRQASSREELFQIVTENAADMIALVECPSDNVVVFRPSMSHDG